MAGKCASTANAKDRSRAVLETVGSAGRERRFACATGVEPPPDQGPGGSERQPPTSELPGLNGAVRDAVNSDIATPPVVPSATDHATSTSRARWNERLSPGPEHTSRHTRAVRVAAAKKQIWRLHWQARAEDEWCIVACRRA